MNLISCENVSLAYEGNHNTVALANVNCTIGAGDFFCVVGSNGSGKTTFIRGLLGLLKPIDGTISFDDSLKHQDIGYLPQQSTIQKSFPASVREVVLSGRLSRLGTRMFYRNEDKQAAHKALDSLNAGDFEKLSFSELSGGQQQRVLIARALCAAPDGLKILILDEPMNGLDAQVKLELYAIVGELNKSQGIAIIMVTHDVQAAATHASHILALDTYQQFFGSTHEFQHTVIGRSLLRDSCGSKCAVCGLEVAEI